MGGDARADPLRQLDEAVAAEVAGHEQELVAAPAHDDVGAAAGRLEEVTELPEDRIARGVAGGIVDGLEVVEVDHHEGQVEEVGRDRAVRQPVVAAVEERDFLLDVLGQEPAVGQAGERVRDAGLGQVVVRLLQLALALAELARPLLDAELEDAGVLRLAVELPLLDARHAEHRAYQEHGVAGEGPGRGPRRRRHVDGDGEALVVPAPVAVGAAQAERVVAGVEVRIGRRAPAAEGDPVRIEPLELVREAVAIGGGVVEGREFESEHLVAEPEADALRLVGGPGHRMVSHVHRGEHDRRSLGGVAEPVGREGVEAVDAAEEQLAARALIRGAEVELAGLEAVADAVVHELAAARVEAAQAVVGAQPEPALPVVTDGVDDVAGQAVARPEGLEGLPVGMQVAEAAVGADPEAARGVHVERVHGVGRKAAWVGREMLEALEVAALRIEKVQALLHGGDPDPPVRRLGHGRDAVAAEARRVLRIVAEVREAPRLGVEAVETAKMVVTPLALRLCGFLGSLR